MTKSEHLNVLAFTPDQSPIACTRFVPKTAHDDQDGRVDKAPFYSPKANKEEDHSAKIKRRISGMPLPPLHKLNLRPSSVGMNAEEATTTEEEAEEAEKYTFIFEDLLPRVQALVLNEIARDRRKLIAQLKRFWDEAGDVPSDALETAQSDLSSRKKWTEMQLFCREIYTFASTAKAVVDPEAWQLLARKYKLPMKRIDKLMKSVEMANLANASPEELKEVRRDAARAMSEYVMRLCVAT